MQVVTSGTACLLAAAAVAVAAVVVAAAEPSSAARVASASVASVAPVAAGERQPCSGSRSYASCHLAFRHPVEPAAPAAVPAVDASVLVGFASDSSRRAFSELQLAQRAGPAC